MYYFKYFEFWFNVNWFINSFKIFLFFWEVYGLFLFLNINDYF